MADGQSQTPLELQLHGHCLNKIKPKWNKTQSPRKIRQKNRAAGWRNNRLSGEPVVPYHATSQLRVLYQRVQGWLQLQDGPAKSFLPVVRGHSNLER